MGKDGVDMMRFPNAISFNRAASLLLACCIGMWQMPAFGQVTPAASALPVLSPSQAAEQVTQDSSAKLAQVPGSTVLQGRVSNVDSISRDILRDEIKLEKYNLQYRLNAAKQGRWKGWRYFFFQETNLGLLEAGSIANIDLRGSHLHDPVPNFIHPGNNIISNSVLLPFEIGALSGGTGDALEFANNAYHWFDNRRKGFSQSQSRKYVAGIILGIDKKLAERESAIRQEPANDAEIAQLQGMEGKLLADFRDLSVAEFERYHIGASRVVAREQSFYLLDGARNAMNAYRYFEGMDLNQHGKPRMLTVYGILATINSSMIMMDPMLARVIGSGAAYLDKRQLKAAGLPALATGEARLQSDFQSLKGFAGQHRDAAKPEVAAAINRMEIYEANNNYYTTEILKGSSEIRRGQHAALQNMGMGLVVGGCSLPFGIMFDYMAAANPHDAAKSPQLNVRIINENDFTGSVIILPAVSVAILDSWRIRATGELAYHRQKAHHTLPGQVIRSRLAQLDQLEAKL
jgi:hypothetical protein